MSQVAVSSQDISDIRRNVSNVAYVADSIDSKVDELDRKTSKMSSDLAQMNDELTSLRTQFEQMITDQRRTAALQQAATELVRVRQEIEQNFSGYMVVRETMLGVLQATDVALVKKSTISRVSEELMLSTPKYWLAPCLVAVSAWISNDRELAERAIAEAVKRDEERTALAMALICRRNNRTDTCYEWLSIYFSKQDAANFSEGSFTYLNAYLNGVFGQDKKHICDDYITKWMREIQENGSLAEENCVEEWNRYCQSFTVNYDAAYPALTTNVHEYADIKAYLERIKAVEPISHRLGIMKNAEINQEKLKANVDSTLISLISRYDPEEEPLRREERYLNAVRFFEGDHTAARAAVMEADRKRKEHTLDLLSQMTNVVFDMERNASPSEKKTAVTFLSPYIQKGFEAFITEKKKGFPELISFDVDGWTGSTRDGLNETELVDEYESFMNSEREAKIAEYEKRINNKKVPIPCIVLLAAGLISLAVNWVLCILLLAGAGAAYFYFQKRSKEARSVIGSINEEYDAKITNGKGTINRILDQWKSARGFVKDFENKPIADIVA